MTKCKYAGRCELYSEESNTCNITGGTYYEDRQAGCYRLMEEKENEKKK